MDQQDAPILVGGEGLMSAPRAMGTTGFWVAPLWLENIIPSSRQESEASWNKHGSKNPHRSEALMSRTHLHICVCIYMCTYVYILAPTAHATCCLFSLVSELTGNPAQRSKISRIFSPKLLSGPDPMSVQKCVALCMLALG